MKKTLCAVFAAASLTFAGGAAADEALSVSATKCDIEEQVPQKDRGLRFFRSFDLTAGTVATASWRVTDDWTRFSDIKETPPRPFAAATPEEAQRLKELLPLTKNCSPAGLTTIRIYREFCDVSFISRTDKGGTDRLFRFNAGRREIWRSDGADLYSSVITPFKDLSGRDADEVREVATFLPKTCYKPQP